MTSDLELLRDYARNQSEESFAALVNRHLNLVYSTALRQVHSPQLAEEVAQAVFMDLSQSACKLRPDTILTAWLYQVTRRSAIDVVRREARRQLREQTAVEMNAMNAAATDWTHIEPLLDDAMEALDDTDRVAVLLRYFENKSLREVGATLGTSDDAAQKRVSRAVERLREFFTKRGVAVGASGLVVVISANAVQAAPVGLVATISTTVALAGTTIATATAAKTITMTILQKTIITAAFAAAVGTGIYKARQVFTLRSQVETLQQQQAPLIEQIEELQHGRDDAARQLAVLRDENERLNGKSDELLRLRGEVTRLRNEQRQLNQSTSSNATNQLHFTQPFFARDEWSDRGTAEPNNTLLTMLWAMKQGDEQRLTQLVLRTNNTETIDKFLGMPRRIWDQVTGVQFMQGLEHEALQGIEAPQRETRMKVIIERNFDPPVLNGQHVIAQSTRSWNLVKTNDQWLITGSGL